MANTRGKRKETAPVDEAIEVIETADIEHPVVETVSAYPKKGKVHNCTKLNVRRAPSTTAPIMKIISEGTKVEVLDEVEDAWYKVHVDGVGTGFCMKEFIKLGK